MTFPAVDTVACAIGILNIALDYADYFPPEVVRAIEGAKKWCEFREKDSVPGGIDSALDGSLENNVPAPELSLERKHLTKVFDICVSIQSVVDQGCKGVEVPLYGAGIQDVVRKVHNALFEWNRFETRSEKLQVDDDLELRLIGAPGTCQGFEESGVLESLTVDGESEIGGLYYGIGESNLFLYAQPAEDVDLDPKRLQKLIFTDHSIKLAPLKPKDEDKAPEKEHRFSKSQFLKVVKGLLSDFMQCSYQVRLEVRSIGNLFEKSQDRQPRKLFRLIRTWFNIFGMSESFFYFELGRAGGRNTFIGIVTSAMLAFFSLLASLFIKYNFRYSLVPILQFKLWSHLQNAVLVYVFPVALFYFYFLVAHLLTHFLSRRFRGQGELRKFSYLQSLVYVPMSFFAAFALIFNAGFFALPLPFPRLVNAVTLLFWLFVVLGASYYYLLGISIIKVTHRISLRLSTYMLFAGNVLSVLLSIGIILLFF